MEIVIETRGPKLADTDRELLHRFAHQLDGVVKVELDLDARSTTLFSSDSHVRIRARVTTTAGEVVERGTVVPTLRDASSTRSCGTSSRSTTASRDHARGATAARSCSRAYRRASSPRTC